MIVLNRQSSESVKGPKVGNFYPKNPPRSGSLSSSAVFSATATGDGFYKPSGKSMTATASSMATAAAAQVAHNHHQHHNLRDIGSSQSHRLREVASSSQFVSPSNYHHSQQVQKPLHKNSSEIFSSIGRFFNTQVPVESHNIQESQQQQQQILQQQEEKREKLNEQRRYRHEMEESVELLRNRVNLLALEESRTVSKMVDTQKRTIEIITNKTSHMQRLQEKHEQHMQREEQMIKRQLELKQMREEKKQRDSAMKSMRVQSATMQAQRITNLKQQYSLQAQRMQEEMLLRKTQSYITVKSHEKNLDVKKQRLLEEQREIAKELYEQKCNSEIQKKMQNQLFYAQLEAKEAELVQRLQFSQNLQKSALHEMKRAVQQSSTPSKAPAQSIPQAIILKSQAKSGKNKIASVKNTSNQDQSHIYYLSP